MGLIDNIIAAFSPERAYRREAFRMAYEELKNYDAGNYLRPNQNWRAFNETAEITDRYSRDSVRARARDLERNSDIMNAIFSAFRRNVIGHGFTLQARVEGNDGLNKELEKAWKRWCKKQNCDLTRTQNFEQIIRMAVNRKKIDGGILFIKCYTKDGIVPFKLQMAEVDDLDTTETVPRHKGNKVVGGIEYDEWNRPVGYYIRQYAIDGFSLLDSRYIEAKNVIFYFTKRRPSQIREMSDMAPTMTRIRDINEFMMAVSVKERIEACLSVFIKRSMPVSGLGRQAVGTAEKPVEYKGKMISPGMIQEMNPGDEIQTVNPGGQAADATSFTKLQQRLAGAGQGLSYEASSRDMSQSNYSSARQGMIEDELTYEEERELLINVMDEIYETFVISAVLCGLIRISDFWENTEKYLEHDWTQEPKAWIDPQKESNANKIALMTGQKTFKQLAAENGKDWREQVKDIADVIEYGEQSGVDMKAIMFGANAAQEETEHRDDE